MFRFFITVIFFISSISFISCGSDDSEKCPDGYHWDDNLGMCVKDDSGETSDESDINTDKDPDSEEKDEIPDTDTHEEDPDNDEPYTGNCLYGSPGEILNIDVSEYEVTIGNVTVNGEEPDNSLEGLLWARNKSTFSDFEIMEIDSSIKGKTFHIPAGTYTFYYRIDENDQKIALVEDMAINSNTTLDMDIPLYTWSGAVLKNSSAYPEIDADKQSETKIIISSGAYKYEIPYEDFGSFTLQIPREKYTVNFEGQLSPGGEIVKATVMDNDNSVEITEDISMNIDIPVRNLSGSISIEGFNVNSGYLAIAEAPPLSEISTILTNSIPDGTYSAEVIGGPGKSYYVLYLPSKADYPSTYINLKQWNDITDLESADITLDFARLYGSLTFRGGNFSALNSCEHSDPLCTAGKLRIQDFGGQSTLVKNLGPDPSDNTYEILLVRRQYLGEDEGVPQYSEKQYAMTFESTLNDVVNSIGKGEPFTMELKHMNQSGTSMVKAITFTDTESNWLTEREINFDVNPVEISGTASYNGSDIETDKDEFIYLRKDGVNTPVINLSESGSSFSFFAPPGTYSILYEGSALLGTQHRAIVKNEFQIQEDTDINDASIEIKSFILTLGLTVNNMELRSFMDEMPENSEINFVVEPENFNAIYTLPWEDKSASPPQVRFIGSNPWTLKMELSSGSKDAVSKYHFTVAEQNTMSGLSADYTLTNDDNPLEIIQLESQLTSNGSKITGAENYRGILTISKNMSNMEADIYYPPSADNTALLYLFPGEYSNGKLMTNDGFDTKQSIFTECIYVDK